MCELLLISSVSKNCKQFLCEQIILNCFISVLVQMQSVLFQVQRDASMLGSWPWTAPQLCNIGVNCLYNSVGPGGGTLHQSEHHLRKPGPTPALPRPHWVCWRIWLHGCWRLRLSLLLSQSSQTLFWCHKSTKSLTTSFSDRNNRSVCFQCLSVL